MSSFTPRTISAALTTENHVAARVEAQIGRAFAAPTTDEHHAEQNRQGLVSFERNAILGAGLKPTCTEAAAYLDRMASRLNGYLAQIDAAKCVLPAHLVGVDASDIALARDRLAMRAARYADEAQAARRSAEAASDTLQRVGV